MDLVDRLAQEIGADALEVAPERLAAVAVDGVAPRVIAAPATREQVARAVGVAEEQGAAVLPRGNGTHAHVGNPPGRYDVALSCLRLDRILRHDAADMTVTVESGLTLSTLAATLRSAGQWLPLDPPRPGEVTIGGLLAADLNGSLRPSHGKARDYLLGLRAVIGGGRLIRGGGEVVKNVAGYDLPKLFVGSFGTLGAIVEATFKVRPLPAADVSLAAACADLAQAGEAALALLDGPVSPFAVDVCNAAAAADLSLPERAHVLIRLGGEAAEVRDQRDRLARLLPACEPIDERREAWRDLALRGAPSCRLSLLPADLASFLAPLEDEARAFGARLHLLAHAGSGTARLRIEIQASPVPLLRWLRFAARQRGGHLFVERLPLEYKREFDVWGDPPAPLELMRRVKDALDPKRTFSPGRFVGV